VKETTKTGVRHRMADLGQKVLQASEQKFRRFWKGAAIKLDNSISLC
jgi:hypothetical protein